MKKTKILLLTATLLALVLLFTSCGMGTISNVGKYLNEDFDPTSDVYNSSNAISELTGYVATDYINDNFIVLASGEAPNVSYKIFSLNSQKVVATLTDSLVDLVVTTYTFELYDDCPIILAKMTQTKAPENLGDAADDALSDIVGGIVGDDIQGGLEDAAQEILDVKYTVYDADGDIFSEDYEPSAPLLITNDTLIFDYKAYTIDKKGVLTEKASIPEYVVLDNIIGWTDDYYYILSDNSVSVYDHSFNPVSVWVAPTYIDKNINPFILNNGNIFVQYTYEVDEDQKRYDITYCEDNRTEKHNLVSLVIDASNGKAKEVDLDYYVMIVMSNYSLNRTFKYFEEVSPYTEKFENIAIIAPIVNKNIDHSDTSRDIVFMNNNGKVKASLKVIDNQTASFISKIGNDRYLAETITGSAVIDAKGNVIKQMNNSLDHIGVYFVGERAIYTNDLEVVYDLAENNAEVMGTVANTVFVKVNTDNGYSVISFCDGEEDTLYTYTDGVPATSTFKLIDNVGYEIVDIASKDHKYYNAEGELLVTTPYELTHIETSNYGDTALFFGLNEGKCIYHTFTIDAE